MRRFVTMLLPALLSLIVLSALAPTAHSAHKMSMFAGESSINLLAPCLEGISKLNYPKNELFFVRHGWLFDGWVQASDAEKLAFMSPATRFSLLIDGQLQKQTMLVFAVPQPDFLVKLDGTENHDGLTGSHLFTGQFFLDASFFGGSLGVPLLQLQCDIRVQFTR